MGYLGRTSYQQLDCFLNKPIIKPTSKTYASPPRSPLRDFIPTGGYGFSRQLDNHHQSDYFLYFSGY